MRYRRTFTLVLLAFSGACGPDEGADRDHCEGEVSGSPSLDITVLDAVTSEPVCDAFVEVTMNGMPIVVFGNAPPDCRFYTYGGKATFVVTVSAPGYLRADPITVEVAEGPECGFPVTEQVEIQLEPL